MEEKKRNFFDSILGCIVLFIIVFIGMALVGTAGHFILDAVSSNPNLYSVVRYAVSGLEIIPVLIIMLIYKPDRTLFKKIAPGDGNNIKFALIGLILGVFCNGICGVVSLIRGDIHLVYNAPNWIYIILAFIAVLLQSGSEEFLCRFFLYRHLERGYKSPWPAIIVPSIIFAALHLLNPGTDIITILHTIFIAMVYALMIYLFDSFWMACFCHMGWNFTQSILLGLPNSGLVFPLSVFKLEAATAVKTISYDPEYGIEGSVLALIINTILMAVLLYFGIKKWKAEKASQDITENTEQ